MAYDLLTRGRVHPAHLWAGALLALSQALRLWPMDTPAWLSLDDVLVR